MPISSTKKKPTHKEKSILKIHPSARRAKVKILNIMCKYCHRKKSTRTDAPFKRILKGNSPQKLIKYSNASHLNSTTAALYE